MNKFFRPQNHDFDSNTIMERSPSGIATVVAKLIIKPHHVKPGTSRTYTCVGRSGMKVVKATSKLTNLARDRIFLQMIFPSQQQPFISVMMPSTLVRPPPT